MHFFPKNRAQTRATIAFIDSNLPQPGPDNAFLQVAWLRANRSCVVMTDELHRKRNL